jgi:hypothetical protein
MQILLKFFPMSYQICFHMLPDDQRLGSTTTLDILWSFHSTELETPRGWFPWTYRSLATCPSLMMGDPSSLWDFETLLPHSPVHLQRIKTHALYLDRTLFGPSHPYPMVGICPLTCSYWACYFLPKLGKLSKYQRLQPSMLLLGARLLGLDSSFPPKIWDLK